MERYNIGKLSKSHRFLNHLFCLKIKLLYLYVHFFTGYLRITWYYIFNKHIPSNFYRHPNSTVKRILKPFWYYRLIMIFVYFFPLLQNRKFFSRIKVYGLISVCEVEFMQRTIKNFEIKILRKICYRSRHKIHLTNTYTLLDKAEKLWFSPW